MIVVPLLVLVLAGGGWMVERNGRAPTERTLSAAASELAGRPVHVRCQSLWSDLFSVGRGNLGEVQFDASGRPSDSTTLTRGTCAHMGRFLSTHGADLDCLANVDWNRFSWPAAHGDPCVETALAEGQAVVTLTHESMHLRGWNDEATAQCYAVQEVAWMVARLGGDPRAGTGLARLALAWTGSMPSEYQSPACHGGGTLDLHPETPNFPSEAVPSPPLFYGPGLR